ncbi:hypothetical protein B0H65DRAFT_108456 [Neurospora tetraspora]|uniref:Uncharacterized protein n=1 Tax=Neurospora tetraspora TaxID=94610 RepID=A0AAE0JKX6_9PEZI|nr:hypothetical protein B0H65DRAFT_108456 [Neurospora tetraspora]
MYRCFATQCSPLCLPELRPVDRWQTCQLDQPRICLPLHQVGDAHGDGAHTHSVYRVRLPSLRWHPFRRSNVPRSPAPLLYPLSATTVFLSIRNGETAAKMGCRGSCRP